MALSASEIYVGYTVVDEKKHVAKCHGCGFRVPYIVQAGVYDSHNVNTCLIYMRPPETRPEWLDLSKYVVEEAG